MQKPKVVVLGAGPAGMSAAWRLSELGCPVTVLERDAAVGGMGKTIAIGRYFADFGPHIPFDEGVRRLHQFLVRERDHAGRPA